MTDLMVDIETLGIEAGAKVISVAAVEFNDQITWNPRVWKLQWWIDQTNRAVNDSTLRFWFEQIAKNPKLYNSAGFDFQNTVPTSGMLDDLGRLMHIADRIWAKSPSFDGVILSHLEGTNAGRNPTFPNNLYRKWRDVRTVEDYLTNAEYDAVKAEFLTAAHDPLEDCVFQIRLVQSAWKKIGYPGDTKDATPEQLSKPVRSAYQEG
jgi:hypothetical protein